MGLGVANSFQIEDPVKCESAGEESHYESKYADGETCRGRQNVIETNSYKQ